MSFPNPLGRAIYLFSAEFLDSSAQAASRHHSGANRTNTMLETPICFAREPRV